MILGRESVENRDFGPASPHAPFSVQLDYFSNFTKDRSFLLVSTSTTFGVAAPSLADSANRAGCSINVPGTTRHFAASLLLSAVRRGCASCSREQGVCQSLCIANTGLPTFFRAIRRCVRVPDVRAMRQLSATNGGRFHLFDGFDAAQLPPMAASRGVQDGSVGVGIATERKTPGPSAPADLRRRSSVVARPDPSVVCHTLLPFPLLPSPRTAAAAGALEVKVVLVGSEGVGKTALRHAWTPPAADEQRRRRRESLTVYETETLPPVAVGRGWRVAVALWDLGGSAIVDRLRSMYLPSSHLFVVVYSAADRGSFRDVRARWAPALLGTPDAPRLLVATHADRRALMQQQAAAAASAAHADGSADSDDVAAGKRVDCVSFEEGVAMAEAIGAVGLFECAVLPRGDASRATSAAVRGQGGLPGLLRLMARLAALHRLGFISQVKAEPVAEQKSCVVQ